MSRLARAHRISEGIVSGAARTGRGGSFILAGALHGGWLGLRARNADCSSTASTAPEEVVVQRPGNEVVSNWKEIVDSALAAALDSAHRRRASRRYQAEALKSRHALESDPNQVPSPPPES